MIKDPESVYLPGARGMFWFKLKRELATLDVVVVAAELGHGKRNNVLSDYTFAVRDETTGKLLPIGKAYSGLTDVEIELIQRWAAEGAPEGNARDLPPTPAWNRSRPPRRAAPTTTTRAWASGTSPRAASATAARPGRPPAATIAAAASASPPNRIPAAS